VGWKQILPTSHGVCWDISAEPLAGYSYQLVSGAPSHSNVTQMLAVIVILATLLSTAIAAVDRYAASNTNFVLLASGRKAVLAARSAARDAVNQPRAPRGHHGLSPWLVLQAQQTSKTRTVWDGAYTDAQAARGEARYRASCISCHNEGPRRGEAFIRDWSGSDVGSLFARIKTSMPPGATGSLSDAEYLDIVAYMLRVNEFPAGDEELRAETAGSIRVEGRSGPEPAPNFALVRVVGCLGAGPGTDWTVTNASAPARTRDPAASTGEELKGSEATQLGSATLRLMNVYPRPEAYTGHKVEAKGFLIRDPNGDRINATAVQSLAPRCENAVP
jgi:mono/diheme cytochrome c family protein